MPACPASQPKAGRTRQDPQAVGWLRGFLLTLSRTMAEQVADKMLCHKAFCYLLTMPVREEKGKGSLGIHNSRIDRVTQAPDEHLQYRRGTGI